jgi:hypothetical protein
VRSRDPRRLLARHRRARARVTIVEPPETERVPTPGESSERGALPPDEGAPTTGHIGPVPFTAEGAGSRQAAQVTLPRRELDRLWSPEYLERLASTYWRFLTRISLGALRVLYTQEAREVVVFTRPFVLLRFHAPEYELEADGGAVTWRIQRGLLVAPAGRGKGFLRIAVRRPAEGAGTPDGEVTVEVSSEVVSFYPMIAGWGWFARIGGFFYRFTQERIHVVVTHAFLRSLANLDLAPSQVGALRAPAERTPA